MANGQTYIFHLEVSLVSPFSVLAIRLDLATRDKRVQVLIILVEFCVTMLTYYNVKNLGGAHKDNVVPMFQTGSGKAVLLSKDSIQKARAVLEGRK